DDGVRNGPALLVEHAAGQDKFRPVAGFEQVRSVWRAEPEVGSFDLARRLAQLAWPGRIGLTDGRAGSTAPARTFLRNRGRGALRILSRHRLCTSRSECRSRSAPGATSAETTRRSPALRAATARERRGPVGERSAECPA